MLAKNFVNSVLGGDMLNEENGNKDFRMIPVALAMWVGCLLGKYFAKNQQNCVYSVVLYISLSLLLVFVLSVLDIKFFEVFKFIKRYNLLIVLTSYAMIAAILLGFVHQIMLQNDPVFRYANKNSNKIALVEASVVTPIRSAAPFLGDCKAKVEVRYLKNVGKDNAIDSSQILKSGISAQLYAYKPVCNKILYGSTIKGLARLKISRFNSDIPEITLLKTGSKFNISKNADFVHYFANYMWNAFYKVTQELDEQGRMLVPGITVGMLGQEFVQTDADFNSQDESEKSENAIDKTYAEITKQHFQHVGIMHIMAVSGGHFLLLALIVRRVCAYFLVPRFFTAFVQLISQLLLAILVYPSASVLRAAFMGAVSAVAFAAKRPYQSASALSWTVILVLLVKPNYSWDYAFAFSCAATFGIITVGARIRKTFVVFMPDWLASILSMTFSAQIFTLPIQMMIQPEVSLMSVPANIVASPLMDIATLCGLISLVLACFSGGISLIFAHFAASATSIIEKCASYLDDSSVGVFAWSKGVSGAFLMIITELTLAVIFIVIMRFLSKSYLFNNIQYASRIMAGSFKRKYSEALEIFDYDKK